MDGMLATVGGEGALRLQEVAVALSQVGAVAFFLGALRLYRAAPSWHRLLLMAGTLMIARPIETRSSFKRIAGVITSATRGSASPGSSRWAIAAW